MKSTAILPCAGRSVRFPGMRPKWLLTTPGGELVAHRAFRSIHPDRIGRTVIGILADHERQYEATRVLEQAFAQDIEVVVLAQDTQGPADTVFQVVELAQVTGPILIKDSDSWFSQAPTPESSFIAVRDLRITPEISRVGQKSFVVVNENGLVVEVVEKSVCSNFFSVGLYSFADCATFRTSFTQLINDGQPSNDGKSGEIFVSHVMQHAIDHGEVVRSHEVEDLVDVGTLTEWQKYRQARSTYIVDIDGVLVRNQSAFFKPYWGDPPTILEKNAAVLRQLQQEGAQLVFMTSRPERYRQVTEALLRSAGLASHALIMQCHHSSRILINDFSGSNAYPTAQAMNLFRNDDRLADLLGRPQPAEPRVVRTAARADTGTKD